MTTAKVCLEWKCTRQGWDVLQKIRTHRSCIQSMENGCEMWFSKWRTQRPQKKNPTFWSKSSKTAFTFSLSPPPFFCAPWALFHSNHRHSRPSFQLSTIVAVCPILLHFTHSPSPFDESQIFWWCDFPNLLRVFDCLSPFLHFFRAPNKPQTSLVLRKHPRLGKAGSLPIRRSMLTDDDTLSSLIEGEFRLVWPEVKQSWCPNGAESDVESLSDDWEYQDQVAFEPFSLKLPAWKKITPHPKPTIGIEFLIPFVGPGWH
jgi:hypothetical protein